MTEVKNSKSIIATVIVLVLALIGVIAYYTTRPDPVPIRLGAEIATEKARFDQESAKVVNLGKQISKDCIAHRWVTENLEQFTRTQTLIEERLKRETVNPKEIARTLGFLTEGTNSALELQGKFDVWRKACRACDPEIAVDLVKKAKDEAEAATNTKKAEAEQWLTTDKRFWETLSAVDEPAAPTPEHPEHLPMPEWKVSYSWEIRDGSIYLTNDLECKTRVKATDAEGKTEEVTAPGWRGVALLVTQNLYWKEPSFSDIMTFGGVASEQHWNHSWLKDALRNAQDDEGRLFAFIHNWVIKVAPKVVGLLDEKAHQNLDSIARRMWAATSTPPKVLKQKLIADCDEKEWVDCDSSDLTAEEKFILRRYHKAGEGLKGAEIAAMWRYYTVRTAYLLGMRDEVRDWSAETLKQMRETVTLKHKDKYIEILEYLYNNPPEKEEPEEENNEEGEGN